MPGLPVERLFIWSNFFCNFSYMPQHFFYFQQRFFHLQQRLFICSNFIYIQKLFYLKNFFFICSNFVYLQQLLLICSNFFICSSFFICSNFTATIFICCNLFFNICFYSQQRFLFALGAVFNMRMIFNCYGVTLAVHRTPRTTFKFF